MIYGAEFSFHLSLFALMFERDIEIDTHRYVFNSFELWI